MALRFMAFVALLRLTIGSSVLIGYSTLPHFLCNGQQNSHCQTPHAQQLPSSTLPDLISHISAPDTVHNDLPLARINTAPELLLFIKSDDLRADVPSVLRRISVAVSPPESPTASSSSSFQAQSDESTSDLSLVESIKVDSVDQLLALASDSSSSIFDNGRTDVVFLSVADEREDGLLAAMQSVADRTAGRMAILWSSRIEDGTDAVAPEALKEKDAVGEGDDANADTAADDVAPADDAAQKAKDADSTDDSTAYSRKMYKPELTESQLAGLLVALVFIILFVPGFMCLWRIQPPQSFDTATKMQ